MPSLRIFLAGLVGFTISLTAWSREVKSWTTNEVLPTYEVAPADPNPRFYEGRTYQGARATFYPYPVWDRLTDRKGDRSYRMLYLENDYLRVSVAPELGGRIFSAVDKSNGYDFFYRQHVIKPALIGMLGAWISGGVEFNVPHHHRATSFLPVASVVTEELDGGRTVWVGETEWRHQMQWSVGITLRPDRSWLELRVRMANATPFAHPMLFWINPAVHANDNYQVLFPPGTRFATQHGKPEFAHWPVAREHYGGVDYSSGVDISWWRNHPSPVSFFAWNHADDWFGGYDHGRRAGVLQVADHHVAPGKKFFEWGVGGEGEAWSRILTDSDGPYLELMAGAWSDNQPDYSWIQPGETREWTHYWYPVRELGGAQVATVDAALNLEVTNRTVRAAANATAVFSNAVLRLSVDGRSLLEQRVTVGPANPVQAVAMVEAEPAPEKLRLSLHSAEGRELAAYVPSAPTNAPMPEPVRPPRSPAEIGTSDELYFTGQRIEQLLSPAYEPGPYYEEMLKRDPGDARANTALGVLLCRQWRWAEAEARLRVAVARASTAYVRPRDGEPWYQLGVALRGQGRLAEAAEAFGQATWSLGWQAASHYALAGIESRRGRLAPALQHATQAMDASAHHPKASALRAALLRRTGRVDEAARVAESALAWNPLDARAAWELGLCRPGAAGTGGLANVVELVRSRAGGDAQACLEIVADEASAGLWGDAVALLRGWLEAGPPAATTPVPLLHYWLAWCLEQSGEKEPASRAFAQAAAAAPDFCFPFRPEEEGILRRALEVNPKDARAAYYLGNLLYDRQPASAMSAWEKARDLDPAFALTHRNLGLAYAQSRGDRAAAIASLTRAAELNPAEPRYLLELDVQQEAAGASVEERLRRLRQHHDIVALRDDALTREIVLLIAAGEHGRALELLAGRRFHNWEGSDDIRDVYVDARLARGRSALKAGRREDARKDFEAAREFPENLEVGRPHRDGRAPEILFHLGLALEALGDGAGAKAQWESVVRERAGGASQAGYCRALALRKLGRDDEARSVLESLVRAGRERLERGVAADYFAKFGQREAQCVRDAQAWHLVALGEQGLGRVEESRMAMDQARRQHPALLGLMLE